MAAKPQGKIFHLDPERGLLPLFETPFALEDELQELLARHPDLLPGDQIDPGSPRRWLLIGREVAVPGDESLWALDHLFVDQDAIPTLVEVKRGSNPELRRTVVGQMLDYAANGPIFWPEGRLRSLFEVRCRAERLEVGEVLRSALGEAIEAEEFWEQVDQNLKSRRIRLLFVTDRMVPELRRLVEFLNQSMETVEVLAVEVRRYAGEGHVSVVPSVYGHTLAAEEKKAARRQRDSPWTREEYLSALEGTCGASAREAAESVLAWAEAEADEVWWGRGLGAGSFAPIFLHGKRRLSPVFVRTNGEVELGFQDFLARAPFDSAVARERFRQRLEEQLGLQIPPEKIDKFPKFSIRELEDPDWRRRFQAEILQAVRAIRGTERGGESGQ